MSTDSTVLSDADLEALEANVTERFVAAVAAQVPQLDLSAWLVDEVPWSDWMKRPLPCDSPLPIPTPELQFPAPRWVTWPQRRAVALTVASACLSHDMLTEAGWLLMYGGREQVA